MYLVAIAWAYVALLMAAAEALSPQGTVFGALVTLLLYGVLPLSLMLYILGTPGRKRRRRADEASTQADAGGHAAPGPAAGLAAEREEP
jgi:membrane protein implicated in regulation of membrane protease activity